MSNPCNTALQNTRFDVRVKATSFTVLTGNRSITKQNLFLGQLSTRMVVSVVDNDAYNGASPNLLLISNTTASIL